MDDMPGRFPPPPDSGEPTGPPGNAGWPPPGPSQPGQSPPLGARDFYPLTIGRIFELTFSLYRFHWRTLVGIALAVWIPISLLDAGLTAASIEGPNWTEQMEALARGRPLDAAWASLASQLPLSLLVGALVGIASHVMTGALVLAASGTFIGGTRPGMWTALRQSLARLIVYAGIYLVVFLVNLGLIAVGGLIAGALLLATATSGQIVPGPQIFLAIIAFVAAFAAILFFAVRWSLAVTVAVLEPVGVRQSLGRSWQLVAGSGWRVLGYILGFGLLVGLIAAVLATVITLIFNPFRVVGLTTLTVDPVRLAIATFVSNLLNATLLPIPTIALMLLYFDLRWRQGEQPARPSAASGVANRS